MVIDGNTFGGGTIALWKDGAPADAVINDGGRTGPFEHRAAGAFFGLDQTTGAPDEVAGASMTRGSGFESAGQSNRSIETRFVAD